ncbi:hypothetical protein K449DRAFT_20026 [Hypoxylon sp. EC38]|nr:hypothetical protein K449DRAFT_20026 [Hypoxylon sp. EC38]
MYMDSNQRHCTTMYPYSNRSVVPDLSDLVDKVLSIRSLRQTLQHTEHMHPEAWLLGTRSDLSVILVFSMSEQNLSGCVTRKSNTKTGGLRRIETSLCSSAIFVAYQQPTAGRDTTRMV